MADFVRSVVEALASYLETELGASVSEVLRDWPDANQEMALPAISITTSKDRFTRCSPYLHDQGETANHQADNKYVVGQYDLTLQVDIWTEYKIQRGSLYQLVFAALNPVDGAGLNLTLDDYHSVKASYTQEDCQLLGGSREALAGQWRAMVTLSVTCKAIAETTEYIITQEPSLVFTTPNYIPED